MMSIEQLETRVADDFAGPRPSDCCRRGACILRTRRRDRLLETALTVSRSSGRDKHCSGAQDRKRLPDGLDACPISGRRCPVLQQVLGLASPCQRAPP